MTGRIFPTKNWSNGTWRGLASVRKLLTASITPDYVDITLADVKLYIAKKGVKEIAKTGCTLASAGTGPLSPATKIACDAIVTTAVNETISAIMAAVDEHEWTAKTYAEIIRHPFYGNILSINDQRNFSEMYGGWLNISHNGMIYTESVIIENTWVSIFAF